ncbi:MAG: hypothetical protein HXX08_11100 [Chloroflexi bacterium]|uniref:DNA 5'-3' helicase n=1 Tax=Candidatus Chlorohelix allophototropha TaxID=3003348 RepID=A0A8T7M3M8_9CHLR|nr:hypothetical protein [Chloroflexota bacterium]WJW65783.1 hypothetical protein OZ401_001562 [Chloroflexota bacterium L227-S17]
MPYVADFNEAQKKRKDEPAINAPLLHSQEAEAAVIGSLLIDREGIVKVATKLDHADFFFNQHATLYQTIYELYFENQPADLITIRDRLRATNKLGTGEGQVPASMILELMKATTTPVHVEYYADIVRNYSALRRLIRIGSKISAAELPKNTKVGEVIADALEEVGELAGWWQSGLDGEYFTSQEKRIENAHKLAATTTREVDHRPVRFGLRSLDGSIGTFEERQGIYNPPRARLKRGNTALLLAYTSTGKTSFVEHVAEANAEAGLNVVFFHNELLQEELEERQYARLKGLSGYKVSENLLDEMERMDVVELANDVAEWEGRLDYVFCPGWTGLQIQQEILRRHKWLLTKTGYGVDLVIVDYIDLLADPEKMFGATKSEKVARNLSDLKDAALKTKSAMLMTSQINKRQSDPDSPPEPALGSGRNSAATEFLANLVMALTREDEESTLKCLKNTNGKQHWTQKLFYLEGRFDFADYKDGR